MRSFCTGDHVGLPFLPSSLHPCTQLPGWLIPNLTGPSVSPKCTPAGKKGATKRSPPPKKKEKGSMSHHAPKEADPNFRAVQWLLTLNMGILPSLAGASISYRPSLQCCAILAQPYISSFQSLEGAPSCAANRLTHRTKCIRLQCLLAHPGFHCRMPTCQYSAGIPSALWHPQSVPLYPMGHKKKPKKKLKNQAVAFVCCLTHSCLFHQFRLTM